MIELIRHALGLCPDSAFHPSLLWAIPALLVRLRRKKHEAK